MLQLLSDIVFYGIIAVIVLYALLLGVLLLPSIVQRMRGRGPY